MTTLGGKSRWLGWVLLALACSTACVERKATGSGDPGADVVDDCGTVCQRYVTCPGVVADLEQCNAGCAEAARQSADAGCTPEFAAFMSCATNTDICSGTAPCPAEANAHSSCLLESREPAPPPDVPDVPDPPNVPPLDPCLAYCEEVVAGGCFEPRTGDCTRECMGVDADAAAIGPECPGATDRLLGCLAAQATPACEQGWGAEPNCQVEFDAYAASCEAF